MYVYYLLKINNLAILLYTNVFVVMNVLELHLAAADIVVGQEGTRTLGGNASTYQKVSEKSINKLSIFGKNSLISRNNRLLSSFDSLYLFLTASS